MKDLNNYIIEKILISKDTKIQYSKPEEYFVEKFGLKLIEYNSTSHTYEMSEEFKKEIIKKLHYNNDFDQKVNNYIFRILDIPYDYNFGIEDYYLSKTMEIYFYDSKAEIIIDSITINKNNQKNTLIYNKYNYNIEKYNKMEGKLFCILDYIIENNIK